MAATLLETRVSLGLGEKTTSFPDSSTTRAIYVARIYKNIEARGNLSPDTVLCLVQEPKRSLQSGLATFLVSCCSTCLCASCSKH